MVAGNSTAISAHDLANIARELYTDGPWLMRNLMRYRIYICPFEELVPMIPPGSSVLDIGCGAGLFLALLAGSLPQITATGFDTSEIAIKTAESMAKRAQDSGLAAQLRFFRLDAAAAWPTGNFDVVSLIDVMHHVPVDHQENVFRKAVETLRPGGLLVYKDMADRPSFPAMMNRLHDLVLARQWIHYVPIRQIDSWAKALKIEPVRAESTSRLWYRHDIRVYRKPPNHVAQG
jgi:2-polyprenyl-3-methyl-5-hydroxy-6-metoxy-1,4-benzoquinol methylase